jgi:hypothetical protein
VSKEKRPTWLTSGKVEPYACPACGIVMDGVTHVGDRQEAEPPKRTGGLTICYYCGAYGIFVTETTLRIAGPADLAQVDPDKLKALELYRADIARRKQAQAQHVEARFLGRGKYGRS